MTTRAPALPVLALLALAASVGCSEAGSGELDVEIRFSTTALPPAEVGTPYLGLIEMVAPPEADLTWTLVRGALPDGLVATYLGNQARIEGVPRAAGTAELTFFVFDSGGLGNAEATLQLTVEEGVRLAILAGSLPEASVDEAYAAMITAQGGSGGYAWRVRDGALPAGLTLTEAGTPNAGLAGRPSEAGRFPFTVEVEDATGATATRGFAIEVAAGAGPLRLEAGLREGGVVGAPYRVEIFAVGGDGPVTWRAEGGIPGVELVTFERQAQLQGTANEAGLFSVDVFATDATATATLTWTQRIVDGLVVLDVSDLPAVTLGEPYLGTVEATPGAGGHRWSVVQGSLPPGLTLAPNGPTLGFAGAATALGDFPLVLEVRDASAQTVTQALTLEVVAPLEIVTTSLVDGVLGQPYASPLEATGGRPPLEWNLVPTGAPPGLVMDPLVGRTVGLAGTAGAVGTFAVAVRVVDADGRVAGRVLPLDILDSGVPLALQTIVVPPLRACEAFSIQVTASGGSNFGYRWRVVGDVPPGVSIDAIGTPTTALAGLFPGGRHAVRVELLDSNDSLVGQDLVLEAPVDVDAPRRAVLGVDDGIGGRLLLADTCQRVPIVIQGLSGVGTATQTAAAIVRGGGQRYIAWIAEQGAGRRLHVTTGNPATFRIATLPDDLVPDPNPTLDLGAVAADGTAAVYYRARRALPDGSPGLVPRVATLSPSATPTVALDVFPARAAPPALRRYVRPDGRVVVFEDLGIDAVSLYTPFGPLTGRTGLGDVPARFLGFDRTGRAFATFITELLYAEPGRAGGPVVRSAVPFSVDEALMAPDGAQLLLRRTPPDGRFQVVDPSAPSGAVPGAILAGSDRCDTVRSGAVAWAAGGGAVACLATSGGVPRSEVRLWPLAPVATPIAVPAPAPSPFVLSQVWVSPDGEHLLFNQLGPDGRLVHRVRRSQPGTVDTLTVGRRMPNGQAYRVWFQGDRVAISGDGALWVHDLGRGALLFQGAGALPEDLNPWRHDGSGLFVRTTAIQWLDLLPTPARLESIVSAFPNIVRVEAHER